MGCSPDRPFCELIAALATVLDMEDDHKLYHAWRVGLIARELARELIPAEEPFVFYAGLLHDLGGIGLPDHIVHRALKPGAEQDPEIRQHPQRGAAMVRLLPGLGERVARLVEEHHEHWDGSGYPRGLKGQEIAPGALLINISDVFDLHLRVAPTKAWEKIRTGMARLADRSYPAELWQKFDHLMSTSFWEYIATDAALDKAILAAMQELPPVEFSPDQTLKTSIILFSQIIDAKHGYTGGHSQRVAAYAVKLARCLGMGEEERGKLEMAGLLHDFGKVAVPRAVLDKPGPLDNDEWQIVKKHPGRTIALLSQISDLKELAEVAGLHHERYDGRGYPYGLQGPEIPLAARIIAVADAFDAMTSPRPYQRTRSPVEALEVLQRDAGSQFDPEVVAVAKVLADPEGKCP